MYQIDFNKPCEVHFIGIGGISMSGLAEILISEGFRVSGSDRTESELTNRLKALGAQIYIGQSADNIKNPDVVVFTAAIAEDNEELVAARDKNIPLMSRAELLGELMNNYQEAINIAGTHGKTTTTSMITEILLEAQKNPTVTVGGILNSIGGNIRVGGSELFVAEACEYTNSFLSFFPTISVILNIEEDHLDFFKDIEDIRSSFKQFINRLPQNRKGFLVINGDIENKEYFLKDLKCDYVTYGFSEEDNYRAENITYDEFARPSYTLIVNGKISGTVKLSVTGEHNVYNSLAAIAVAERLGISLIDAKAGLKHYTGTRRRFELKGEYKGIKVIDDYAHHPREIRATIEAARKYPHERLVIVFQPHTYTRTNAFLDDFARELSKADLVVIDDIYAAREKNTIGISSKLIVDKINESGGNAYYVPGAEKIIKFIEENLQTGDLLITMGAGNIVEVGNQLVSM